MIADLELYLSSVSMTMRSGLDRWTDGFSEQLNTMLRFPLGWVNADGSPNHIPTGKRIRPILLLLCTQASGGDWKQALPAAAAVELLHNFSLVHDDIQDDSPTRHGRDTVWRIWGKPNAINIGDGLFAISYAALSELPQQGVSHEIVHQVMNIFNRTNLELIRGQYLDMAFERQELVSLEEYVSMIRGKSAALIAACAQIGALIGSGDSVCAAQYAEFGLNLGLAFQIRDDILGVWGDPSVTGKSTATDILARKKSLPILHGLHADARLLSFYRNSDMSAALVAEVITLLEQCGSLDYAKQQETEYYEKAINALHKTGSSGEGASILRNLARQLLGRSH
ncbi:MAG: polyprenyl synthetase family protein [Anaerolineae bacterium]|nr:polyprenyl synthetase family protein [Anaerolineae bacterium]NUQ02531.1 polyprenyl synthetase family protein [Anaerolineae bacterium]